MINTYTAVKIDTESVKPGEFYKIKLRGVEVVGVVSNATQDVLTLKDISNMAVDIRIKAEEIKGCQFTKMKLVEDAAHVTPVSDYPFKFIHPTDASKAITPECTQYRIKPDKKSATDCIPKTQPHSTFKDFEKELREIIKEAYKGCDK